MSFGASVRGMPSDEQLLGTGTASFIYRDRHFRTEAIKVLPGEYYATGSEIMIVTLLGSCVAACLRDSKAQVGGMNHFLLPHDKSQDAQSGARFGLFAMEVLVNALLSMGAKREAMEAKVFGGANVVKSMSNSKVGQENSDFVLDFLRREHIRVVAEDLGGERPRRVHYFPRTGQAMVKLLGEVESQQISRAEHDLEDRAAHTSGDVELFT